MPESLRDILDQMKRDGILPEPTHCPECGTQLELPFPQHSSDGADNGSTTHD